MKNNRFPREKMKKMPQETIDGWIPETFNDTFSISNNSINSYYIIILKINSQRK